MEEILHRATLINIDFGGYRGMVGDCCASASVLLGWCRISSINRLRIGVFARRLGWIGTSRIWLDEAFPRSGALVVGFLLRLGGRAAGRPGAWAAPSWNLKPRKLAGA